MTMPLLFRAMTKECDCLLLCQMLEETQRELLTVVLNSSIPSIDLTGVPKFL